MSRRPHQDAKPRAMLYPLGNYREQNLNDIRVMIPITSSFDLTVQPVQVLVLDIPYKMTKDNHGLSKRTIQVCHSRYANFIVVN